MLGKLFELNIAFKHLFVLSQSNIYLLFINMVQRLQVFKLVTPWRGSLGRTTFSTKQSSEAEFGLDQQSGNLINNNVCLWTSFCICSVQLQILKLNWTTNWTEEFGTLKGCFSQDLKKVGALTPRQLKRMWKPLE